MTVRGHSAIKRFTCNLPHSEVGRTQTKNAQLYLAEPYSVHYQVASAMNNAEPLCAGVWRLVAQLFSTGSIYKLVHMREINRMWHK